MLYSTRFFLSGVCAAILCWGILGDSLLEAQQRNKPPQQPTKMPVTLEDGVFRSVTKVPAGYVLEVESLVGEKWKCLVTPQSQIVATGEAAKDFLKKGAYVSFDATVKLKKATVETPISEVTLFTPDARCPMGAFQTWNAPELYVPPKERKPKSEHEGMVPGGGMNFGNDAGSSGTQKKQKPPEEMELTLRGMVATVAKTGAATVNVPANPHFKGVVKCHFAEDLTVHVVLGGAQAIQFLKPGDQVSVTGNTQMVNSTSMEVTSVDIKYENELEVPGKKKPAEKAEATEVPAKKKSAAKAEKAE